MTYKKTQELAIKFAKEVDYIPVKPVYFGDDERFDAQRVKLEEYFYELYPALRRVLSEIEGDILALRTTGIDDGVLKTLGKVFHTLNDFVKRTTTENPYITIEKISEWLNDRNNKAVIDNLNFIIERFLAKNKPEINTHKGVSHLTVNGLKNLIKQIEKANAYMQANPLLPDPRNAITAPPPKKLMNEETSSIRPTPADPYQDTEEDIYEAIQTVKSLSK